MPPRKSDAAGRKNDNGVAAPAVAAEEPQPTTAASQVSKVADLTRAAEIPDQTEAADARPTTAEREHPRSRNNDAITIEVGHICGKSLPLTPGFN